MKRIIFALASAALLASCGASSSSELPSSLPASSESSSVLSSSSESIYSESSYEEEEIDYTTISRFEAKEILRDIYDYYEGEVYCIEPKATIINETHIDDPGLGKMDMTYHHDFDKSMAYYRVYTKLDSPTENVELTQFKFYKDAQIYTVNRYEDGSENTWKSEDLRPENFMDECNPYYSVISEFTEVYSLMAQAVNYTGTSTKSTFRTVLGEEGTLQLEFSYTASDGVFCHSILSINNFLLTETVNEQIGAGQKVYVDSHFKVIYNHLLHYEKIPDFSSYKRDDTCHNEGQD